MNKSVVAVVVIVLVVLGGGGAYLALHKSSKNSNSNSSSTSHMNMNSSSNSGNSNATATNSVTIQNFAFSPANITIKKGTTVTWTNQDSVAHTVTETDGQNGPKSSNITPGGGTFVFTFDNPGTYKYHCSIHPEMTGTVTVTN